MKKLKEFNNPLLEYKRVTLEIEHNNDKTPSNQDVLNKVSKELNVNAELIKIKHIYSHFGSSKSKIIANVYKNAEMLKKIEEIKKKPKAKKEKKQQAKKE